MAKKRKSPIEKGIEALIIKTVKEAKEGTRAPGADKLLAIARLLNSYARLRGGSPVKAARSLQREDMTESEWLEHCAIYGDGSYAELLEE